MDLLSLCLKSRSFRRFDETYPVKVDSLYELIKLAQYSPSGNNIQPLKYWISHTPEMNQVIFSQLGWAGGLKDWHGPEKGERPSAYILILGDTEISVNFGVDHGIAAQSMKLGAAVMGLGTCMIASIQREVLSQALGIPGRYQILLALAIGKPAEIVVTEPVSESGSTNYYRDDDEVHHVPKRSLEELILNRS